MSKIPSLSIKKVELPAKGPAKKHHSQAKERLASLEKERAKQGEARKLREQLNSLQCAGG